MNVLLLLRVTLIFEQAVLVPNEKWKAASNNCQQLFLNCIEFHRLRVKNMNWFLNKRQQDPSETSGKPQHSGVKDISQSELPTVH